MPHILTFSTLYPNANQPNFGIFVERQTQELAGFPGHKVTVVNPLALPPFPLSLHPRYKAVRGLKSFEIWRGLEVYRPRFQVIPGLAGQWNPKALAVAVLPLIKKLHKKQAFDAIDAEFFYPDGPAAMAIAAELDLPFSVKARGADIHHWSQNPACLQQLIATSKAASGLLAVSAALKADMVALGMAADKIKVHYTGIDAAHFAPMDRKIAKQKQGINGPALLCIGALIPRKGQALVIEALAKLPATSVLLLAGSGPDLDRLRRFAVDLGVADRVRFLGAVKHAELPALINAADVMVLPSASEGLANAWVESLSCGTPIVISDAGGAGELVRSKTAGAIVPRDAHAIAAAVAAILAMPPRQNAVRACVKDFSWDKNGAELKAHFQGILGG